MVDRNRTNWSSHIQQVIRSQHYTRLAEGLAGEPLEQALMSITADMMHICKRQGLPWESVMERSRALFEREEQSQPAP